MYFWNINKLKEDLKKGPLSESASFKYFFVYVLLFAIATLPMEETTQQSNLLTTITYSTIGMFGLYYAYKSNGGAQGKDFISRYLSVSIAASIRWMVMVFIPFMIGYMLFKILSGSLENTVIDTVFFAVVSIILYWKICGHLKDIANGK